MTELLVINCQVFTQTWTHFENGTKIVAEENERVAMLIELTFQADLLV